MHQETLQCQWQIMKAVHLTILREDPVLLNHVIQEAQEVSWAESSKRTSFIIFFRVQIKIEVEGRCRSLYSVRELFLKDVILCSLNART